MVRNNDAARMTSEAGPLRALWRTVLMLALADAAKGRDANWIGSRDFRLTCALAGVDPDAVLRTFEADRDRLRQLRAA
jgi:hypothetical protein